MNSGVPEEDNNRRIFAFAERRLVNVDAQIVSKNVEQTRASRTPITLLANEVRFRVARPRSPTFTEPVGPVIKILSHLRSRWIIGGFRVCRKLRPFKICLHQLRNTFGLTNLNLLRYLSETMNKSLQTYWVTLFHFLDPYILESTYNFLTTSYQLSTTSYQ